MVDDWGHFKKVTLKISVDGLGPLNEYIRFPSKWETVMRNIDRYDSGPNKSNMVVTVSCTLQAYNIFSAMEFLTFFSSRGIPVMFNVLYSPNFLSISALPQELAKLAFERIAGNTDHPELLRSLSLLNSCHSDEWGKFIAFNRHLDRIRGQNFESLIPELKEPESYL
jgi:sulfatase maturation enzyme AslB (radical SAM superfamily)